jgi:hypothetical protein
MTTKEVQALNKFGEGSSPYNPQKREEYAKYAFIAHSPCGGYPAKTNHATGL